ncbi:hypothetical protein MLD38_040152 [Melastoma candidum]|uniref:Uncharacterized protein n=1 Tax=Melastoma candidum TaxID=119954 RepID=A0ACB9L4C9_9MYRT|nr:hypothetical protein MLD38_040152 [Melastoma candidum]
MSRNLCGYVPASRRAKHPPLPSTKFKLKAVMKEKTERSYREVGGTIGQTSGAPIAGFAVNSIFPLLDLPKSSRLYDLASMQVNKSTPSQFNIPGHAETTAAPRGSIR